MERVHNPPVCWRDAIQHRRKGREKDEQNGEEQSPESSGVRKERVNYEEGDKSILPSRGVGRKQEHGRRGVPGEKPSVRNAVSEQHESNSRSSRPHTHTLPVGCCPDVGKMKTRPCPPRCQGKVCPCCCRQPWAEKCPPPSTAAVHTPAAWARISASGQYAGRLASKSIVYGPAVQYGAVLRHTYPFSFERSPCSVTPSG